jgi:hypothetical protein
VCISIFLCFSVFSPKFQIIYYVSHFPHLSVFSAYSQS